MPTATLHDGTRVAYEIHGSGPAVLLPVDPVPKEGAPAEELRRWGMDPALGRILADGLGDAFQVIAFDYEGHRMRHPAAALTPGHLAADLLAVADAAGGLAASPTTATRGSPSPDSSSPCAPTASPPSPWAASRRWAALTRRCSGSPPPPTPWPSARRARRPAGERSTTGPVWTSRRTRPRPPSSSASTSHSPDSTRRRRRAGSAAPGSASPARRT
ncbi:hypothetical protein NQP46_32065 [Streptomyces albus]|nr:hypothetical protein NQP46_32065 [Streptomyces albus]